MFTCHKIIIKKTIILLDYIIRQNYAYYAGDIVTLLLIETAEVIPNSREALSI